MESDVHTRSTCRSRRIHEHARAGSRSRACRSSAGGSALAGGLLADNTDMRARSRSLFVSSFLACCYSRLLGVVAREKAPSTEESSTEAASVAAPPRKIDDDARRRRASPPVL